MNAARIEVIGPFAVTIKKDGQVTAKAISRVWTNGPGACTPRRTYHFRIFSRTINEYVDVKAIAELANIIQETKLHTIPWKEVFDAMKSEIYKWAELVVHDPAEPLPDFNH